MAKQSIFGRIQTLVRANLNALLDQAEDPQKMLDQLVRDYSNSIADAESAIAETIGNLRLLERDHQEDVQAAAEWGNKALAASRKGDELRAGGNLSEADKFDNLAKIALQRQITAEGEAKAAAPTIAAQTEVVDKLKDGLNGMKTKLEQLKAKRNELTARRRQAGARRLEHRRAVQRSRRRRRAHRGRSPSRGSQGRRSAACRHRRTEPRPGLIHDRECTARSIRRCTRVSRRGEPP